MAWGDLVVSTVRVGSGDPALSGIDDLDFAEGPGSPGEPVLYASSGAGGAITAWSVTGGALGLLDRADLPPRATAGVDGEVVVVPGAAPLVATTGAGAGGLFALDLDGPGEMGGRAALGPTLPVDLHDAIAVTVGGATHLFGLRLGSDAVSAWSLDAGGAPVAASDPAPARPPSSGPGIAALDSVVRDGTTFLVGAAAGADSLVVWRVGPDGLPVETARIGPQGGLGIDSPADVATARLGDRAFAVMAASGSGTLTVAEVRPDGSLAVTDQVLDDLGTRFAHASQVASAEAGGRVFVAAAGSDSGVSLFELLPGGRLLLIDSVEDTTGSTLGSVAALDLVAADGVLRLAVASGAEPGITLLTAPLPRGGTARATGAGADSLAGTEGDDRLGGGGGDDTLQGGRGDDVLMDGAGSDRLDGGDGSDDFVLSADGATDVITGFAPGEDRIDLTGWPSLRSVGQLTLRSLANGAEIRFGGETLRILTATGAPLDEAAVRGLDILTFTRLVLPGRGGPDPDAPRSLVGTAGDDALAGAGGADRIMGGGGADGLEGGGGADLLVGGGGSDRLLGGDGDDALHGGGGADRIRGDAGGDRLWGDEGADVLSGGDGDDRIWGQDGSDRLLGGGGADAIGAGEGDDRLRGDVGADGLEGGRGDDSLEGNEGDDSLAGGDGLDRMWGGAGADRLLGGAAADSAWGGSGDDAFFGEAGADWFQGGGGDDLASGGVGRDTVLGGAGRDRATGGEQADLLEGGSGADSLDGGDGADSLAGGPGRDWLSGGLEADLLDGGAGDDVLTGGGGADTFVFQGGRDVVTDFRGGDRLRLDDALWGGGARAEAALIDGARASGGGLLLAFGNGDALRLEGVTDARQLLGSIEWF